MRIALPLALAELVRAPGRTLLRVLILAAAVGLLGAMVLFVGHSLHTMTGGALRSVPIAWQGPVGDGTAARRLAAGVARQPGVAAATAAATAPFAGIEHVLRSVYRPVEFLRADALEGNVYEFVFTDIVPYLWEQLERGDHR